MPSLMRRIRDGLPVEAQKLEDLQWRASLVWEEDRDYLESHPDAIEVPLSALEAHHVRVADGTTRPLGFSVLLPGTDGIAELDGLFVDPAFFRRGIGRALVEDGVVRARDRSWQRIEVTANPRAVEFYVKLGFTDDGVVRTRFAAGLRMHRDTGCRPGAGSAI